MPDRLPVDAVIFEAGALLAATGPDGAGPGRARPGARRLVAALARAGATVAVTGEPADRTRLRLADAGFPATLPVGAAEIADLVAPDPARTLLVTAPAEAPRDTGTRDPGPRPGAAAGTGDPATSDGATVEADATEAAARTDPATPDTATGTGDPATPEAAAVVTLEPGRLVHHAVHAWLAGAVGPFAASGLLWAPLDAEAVAGAEEHHLRLTKPPGSLGRLEALGVQLAGIAAEVPPPVPRPAAVAVFAGDHGVHRQGVSPWPQEVTAQMVANFLAGGAAINVLARQAGADVVVVDVGVAADLDDPGNPEPDGTGPRLLHRKVRAGTGDLSTGPAMTREQARRALDVGVEVAADLAGDGARCLVTGDMGIANTTPSAALIAALTGRTGTAVTGHGAGLDRELLAHKAAVVEAAAARARAEHGDDPLAILAEVGGLEHAALAGFVVGAAALQVPVVVDGVIAAAALLVAARLVPGVERAAVAGHRSVEPGSAAVLAELGLDPLVDLGLRLGEGTGAALALPLVEAAARVVDEMATFDQAGVSGKGA